MFNMFVACLLVLLAAHAEGQTCNMTAINGCAAIVGASRIVDVVEFPFNAKLVDWSTATEASVTQQFCTKLSELQTCAVGATCTEPQVVYDRGYYQLLQGLVDAIRRICEPNKVYDFVAARTCALNNSVNVRSPNSASIYDVAAYCILYQDYISTMYQSTLELCGDAQALSLVGFVYAKNAVFIDEFVKRLNPNIECKLVQPFTYPTEPPPVTTAATTSEAAPATTAASKTVPSAPSPKQKRCQGNSYRRRHQTVCAQVGVPSKKNKPGKKNSAGKGGPKTEKAPKKTPMAPSKGGSKGL